MKKCEIKVKIRMPKREALTLDAEEGDPEKRHNASPEHTKVHIDNKPQKVQELEDDR